MTPTHANKKGVRYRYYVSHALLQGQASQAGSVARISAPDVEALIVNRLRASRDAGDDASEREIIEKSQPSDRMSRPDHDHTAIGRLAGRSEQSERCSDDLGPIHSEPAPAQGNLSFAIRQ